MSKHTPGRIRMITAEEGHARSANPDYWPEEDFLEREDGSTEILATSEWLRVDRADLYHLAACWNAIEDIGGDPATIKELRAACEAAIRYDAEIQKCANDPDKMASHCTAQGDSLDTLYDDWIAKARAAIAKAKGA